MTQELDATEGIGELRICPRWNMFTAAKNRLASSLRTKPDMLNRLAHTGNTSVQQRVAENSTTNSATLDFLSLHESSDIRSAVAQNENCLSTTVDALAGDSNCDVRFAMAANPWTSAKLLQRLAEDENPYVQIRAQRTQARLKVEETLLADHGRGLTMSFQIAKTQHHPFALFCQNLFHAVSKKQISLADLAAMPKETQMLLAHSLLRRNPELTLLDDDTDVCKLLSAGWLTSVPCTTIGIICFRIKPVVWRRLVSLCPAFLNHDLLSQLAAYKKRKSAQYPWVW